MIYLLVAIYLLTLFLAALVGYWWRGLIIRLRELYRTLEGLKERVPEPKPKPEATLLDPDNVAQLAQFEHDERIRKLNGGQ